MTSILSIPGTQHMAPQAERPLATKATLLHEFFEHSNWLVVLVNPSIQLFVFRQALLALRILNQKKFRKEAVLYGIFRRSSLPCR